MKEMPHKEDFARMCELYAEWNGKINVISRKDIDKLYEHHILHSLAILSYWQQRGDELDGAKVLDLGTGGGFPGIPLAFCLPETRFTLCDSIGKKIKVAQAVSDSLDLKNITCVNARVESLDERFDYVVSRAVAPLETLWGWVKDRFSRSLICLKGGDITQEIADLCRKWNVSPSKISVLPVGESIKDEYFQEKFVIEVRK